MYYELFKKGLLFVCVSVKMIFREQITCAYFMLVYKYLCLLSEEVSLLPNIKSAIKRDALSKDKRLSNRSKKSNLRSTIKIFDIAVTEGDREAAAFAYKTAVKSIDRAAGKGLIHKNSAARKKSRLTLAINSMAE